MIVGHKGATKISEPFKNLPLPSTKQGLSEISVDGGKVRLRGEPKAGSHWKDYKAVRLQGIYYGAFFDDNQSLIDYDKAPKIAQPIGLGDGPMRSLESSSGIWHRPTAVGNLGLVPPQRKSL